MTPTDFPESNRYFIPPDGIEDSQCGSIRAYRGVIDGGSLDGIPVAVVAWKPEPADLHRLIDGGSVFLSCVGGGLPMHLLTTDFQTSIHPA